LCTQLVRDRFSLEKLLEEKNIGRIVHEVIKTVVKISVERVVYGRTYESILGN
jgi:hypothetical protein